MIGGDALSTNNVIDSLSYRATGKASQVVYGNDRKLDLTYNAGLSQLTNMTATRWDGSEKIIDHNYTYEDNGLISRTDDYMDGVYTRGYAYNYRNQLSTVYGDNYSQSSYSFDNFGNLTNGMTFPKIGTSDVPVNNRPGSYTSGGTTINFTYDNSGNMTAAGSTSYQWDGANRLKSVNSGTLGSYGFDGNGKRVRKAESGATTYYVYSSVIGSAVMEVASAGVQRAYVMNGSSVVAQRNSDGQFYWLHQDHLGSGRKMTDTSGNMTYRAEFDPYGKLLLEWSQGNVANRNSKKFTGYERDAAIGLDYAQARMYSSEWGRFMSPDPKGFAAANKQSPLSLNRYSYAGSDPVNHVDRAGTDWNYFTSPGTGTFNPWSGWLGPLGGLFGSGISFGGFTGTSTADFDIDYFSYANTLTDYLSDLYSIKLEPLLKATIHSPLQNLSNCGSASYEIRWNLVPAGPYLDFNDQANGWVIQHVKRYFSKPKTNAANQSAQANNESNELWEAWRVTNGSVWVREPYDAEGTDIFETLNEGIGSKGVIEVLGYAKFISDESIDPSNWGQLSSSFSLRATTRQPSGWTDKGGLKHSLTVDWDCTKDSVSRKQIVTTNYR